MPEIEEIPAPTDNGGDLPQRDDDPAPTDNGGGAVVLRKAYVPGSWKPPVSETNKGGGSVGLRKARILKRQKPSDAPEGQQEVKMTEEESISSNDQEKTTLEIAEPKDGILVPYQGKRKRVPDNSQLVPHRQQNKTAVENNEKPRKRQKEAQLVLNQPQGMENPTEFAMDGSGDKSFGFGMGDAADESKPMQIPSAEEIQNMDIPEIN